MRRRTFRPTFDSLGLRITPSDCGTGTAVAPVVDPIEDQFNKLMDPESPDLPYGFSYFGNQPYDELSEPTALMIEVSYTPATAH